VLVPIRGPATEIKQQIAEARQRTQEQGQARNGVAVAAHPRLELVESFQLTKDKILACVQTKKSELWFSTTGAEIGVVDSKGDIHER
jgi:hypothetical protein